MSYYIAKTVSGPFETVVADVTAQLKEQGFGNVIFTASVSASLVNLPQKQAAVSIPI